SSGSASAKTKSGWKLASCSSPSKPERPIDGDRDALLRLPAAGLATPDVVTLSQLIAFLSYQTRLVAGLRALREASQAHPAHQTGQPAASTETAA
ncbi:hypothetical protein ACQCQE_25270, partial [Ralstonia pseudosolanacearum]